MVRVLKSGAQLEALARLGLDSSEAIRRYDVSRLLLPGAAAAIPYSNGGIRKEHWALPVHALSDLIIRV